MSQLLLTSLLAGGMRLILFQAGFRSERAFSLFLGSKALLLLVLPLLAYLLMPAESSAIKRNGAMLGAAEVGMMAPEFFIFEALQKALARFGQPEIFSFDQGSQPEFNRSPQH